ncbi:hypothetical protein BC834DRAFT_849078 [Gloeopeniophorella convolvens]|nr:hypothetical protein BC834DRAFT_849078 [Gloeopeniophorella convolvens]
MLIHLFARNSTGPYTCAPSNPYCLSVAQTDDDDDDAAASANPSLSHRNLIGVLVIAVLLLLGIVLWLCFGKWSKPVRRLLRGEPRDGGAARWVRFGDSGSDAEKGTAAAHRDAEKTAWRQSASSQGSLDQDAIEIEKVELAMPEKVRAACGSMLKYNADALMCCPGAADVYNQVWQPAHEPRPMRCDPE